MRDEKTEIAAKLLSSGFKKKKKKRKTKQKRKCINIKCLRNAVVLKTLTKKKNKIYIKCNYLKNNTQITYTQTQTK